VLLENYLLSNALEENGITQDDFEMFNRVWQLFDVYCTQFIPVSELSNFISKLEKPFGVPKPNDKGILKFTPILYHKIWNWIASFYTKAISLFNVPIIKGDLVHYLDVLHAVTKYALGSIEEDDEFYDMQTRLDLQFLKMFPMRTDYVPISSTLLRKKQDLAVRKLQKNLKKYLIKKRMNK
jgi:hypothetical protein